MTIASEEKAITKFTRDAHSVCAKGGLAGCAGSYIAFCDTMTVTTNTTAANPTTTVSVKLCDLAKGRTIEKTVPDYCATGLTETSNGDQIPLTFGGDNDDFDMEFQPESENAEDDVDSAVQ
eukprot:Nk52_evm3s620 gene=Nk52_evmTU3s620